MPEEDAAVWKASFHAAWEAGQISESGRQSKEVFSAVVRRMMAAGELTEKPAAAEVYDASFLNQARELLNASQLCRKHGAA